MVLASATAYGQITLKAGRSEIYQGDPIEVTVEVTVDHQSRPQLLGVDDFQVMGRGQSTQIQMVNGRTTRLVAYGFQLHTQETGTFTIGPAVVRTASGDIQSNTVTVKIVPASARPKANDDIIVRAKVENSRPYVGEQVIYTLSFYRAVQINDANLTESSFDGFLAESLGEQQEYTTVLRGKRFRVTELKKVLFPQEAGELTISPASIRAAVVVQRRGRGRGMLDDFFGGVQTKPTTVTGNALTLSVRPLPPAPPGYQGLVGDMEFSASLSKSRLRQGESTTLELVISGTTLATNIQPPQVELPESVKVYDDKPEENTSTRGNTVVSTKTFRRSLVPTQPGTVTIPAITLTSFLPKQERYITHTQGPFTLEVDKSSAPEEIKLTEAPQLPATTKQRVEILGDDILPPHTDADSLQVFPRAPRSPVLPAAALVTPALLYWGLAMWLRRKRLFASDTALQRRHEALSKAQQELKRVDAVDASEQPAAIAGAVRRYIGDKLNVEGTALTSKEIAGLLEDKAVAQDVAKEVVDLVAWSEQAAYGGKLASGEAATKVQAATQLLKSMERSL